MKKIEAIIRPEVFPQVREGLALEGIDGLSISEIVEPGDRKVKSDCFAEILSQWNFRKSSNSKWLLTMPKFNRLLMYYCAKLLQGKLVTVRSLYTL